MKFIVDTSVAVKWFVDEDGRSDARLLLGSGISRAAPDLIFIEAANALRKAAISSDAQLVTAGDRFADKCADFSSSVIRLRDIAQTLRRSA